MTTYTANVKKEMNLRKLLCTIFIPSLAVTIVYISIGVQNHTIPSILLFYICAAFILFPIEISVVLHASKKEYGSYSLKSAFTNYNKMSRCRIFMYGSLLFAFAGLMSVTLAPLENSLFAPISNKLIQSMPTYFDWSNIEFLKQYSNDILLLTCIACFIFNVIVGPIVEELFFRGYLTSKISRYGNFAPLIVTILFSLYHLWLPFNNLFRISVFFPAALIAWKNKNIYISIVFHCLCNLMSTVSFIKLIY